MGGCRLLWQKKRKRKKGEKGRKRKGEKKEGKERTVHKEFIYITAHSEQGRGHAAGEAPEGGRGRSVPEVAASGRKNLGGGKLERGGEIPPEGGGGKIFGANSCESP